MAFVGYGTSGKTYDIASEKGMNFINSAVPGTSLQGGDGSFWTKNQDGTTTIKRGNDTWTVGSALGNLQNAMDMITQQSEKSSARSLEYAHRREPAERHNHHQDAKHQAIAHTEIAFHR